MCDSYSDKPLTSTASSKKKQQGTLWIPGAILALMFVAGLLVWCIR